MSCYTKTECHYNFNIKTYGLCDLGKILIDGSSRAALNWNEISVPEILTIPTQKPDIENIDQVYVDTAISSVKLIETPVSYDSYDILAGADVIAALTDILDTVTTTIVTPANALGALLTAVATAVNAVDPLPAGAADLVTTLTNQVTTLTTTVTALTTTVTNVTAGLAVVNLTVAAFCALVATLRTALTALQTLLTAISATITALLAIPELAAVQAVTDAITAVTDSVTAIVTAITTVLTDLLQFNNLCNNQTNVIVIKPNAEGTCLSGRKLIIEGSLDQKVVYTANIDAQSVHSADFTIPFSAFVIPYAKFENGVYTEDVPVLIDDVVTQVDGFVFGPNAEIIPDLCEEFCVEVCIEDIFAYTLDARTVFKNITLFLYARTSNQCS